jgi:hypothetical protein
MRECRKEAKELLVIADTAIGGKKTIPAAHQLHLRMMDDFAKNMTTEETANDTGEKKARAEAMVVGNVMEQVAATGAAIGTGKAFLGGGCCVHLSIEYMPASAVGTSIGVILVFVVDSEQTVLAWGKFVKPGASYQIKEGIISTKPGAMVRVVALNVTSRLRWCEVFSC